MYEIIFDLETKTFFDETGDYDASKLGVSVISLYHRQTDSNHQEISGHMFSFWEADFDKMWKLFQEADRIIGFNSIGFDIPVLSPYAPAGFSKLPHFDILSKIKDITGRRVSLNSVASQTLGNTKIDSGVNAVKYWKKGDKESLQLLQQYCEADVAITRDIYDFGLKNKYLKFIDHWNNPRQISVDFSYPQNSSSTIQTSLF